MSEGFFNFKEWLDKVGKALKDWYRMKIGQQDDNLLAFLFNALSSTFVKPVAKLQSRILSWITGKKDKDDPKEQQSPEERDKRLEDLQKALGGKGSSTDANIEQLGGNVNSENKVSHTQENKSKGNWRKRQGQTGKGGGIDV